MAKCNVTATGVDSRVSSCGSGHFCCYEDNSTACCDTPSKGFFLGVATVVTAITGPSAISATTNSRTSAMLPNLAVTSQGGSPSITSASATSNTHSAASTIIHTPHPSGGSDRHVAVGVGAGVGVPVGLAILAGILYLVRRRSKTRPETSLEMHSMANDKNDSRLRESCAEGRFDELPAENKSTELSDGNDPRAELQEIREHRADSATI